MANSKNTGCSDEITNNEILYTLKNSLESLDSNNPGRPHWTEIQKNLLDLFGEKLEQLKIQLNKYI